MPPYTIRVSNDWIQIRIDILLVLIWVQTVCKGYQQMIKGTTGKERARMDIDFGDYFGWELKMCQSDTDAPISGHCMRENLCMGWNVHTGCMEIWVML